MAQEQAGPAVIGPLAAGTAADPRSDAHLVRELIEGSHEALGVLYDRHVNVVYGGAMRVTRDAWVAAEVVQETFLALWNRAETFDASRGGLATWLLTIARNRTVDHFRSARRHDRAASFSSFSTTWADDRATAEWLAASGELVGTGGAEPAPDTVLADKETRESVGRAVASLDPMERRVIQLAYGEGLSQSEIATRLGWPIGTVKTRTRRALHHLRDLIGGPGTDEPAAVLLAEPVASGLDRSGESAMAGAGQAPRRARSGATRAEVPARPAVPGRPVTLSECGALGSCTT